MSEPRLTAEDLQEVLADWSRPPGKSAEGNLRSILSTSGLLEPGPCGGLVVVLSRSRLT